MTSERVQIPAYSDHWMIGDRYGELVKVTKGWRHDPAKPGSIIIYERAHVKLDKSGKTMRFLLADCTLV